MTKDPFYSAYPLIYELFGVEIDEDTFETLGMIAWKKIGNKDYKIKIVHMHPQQDPSGGWFICKPCDLDQIEAITLPFEDAQTTSSVNNNNLVYTAPVEAFIETGKFMPHELYMSGKYVKYKELGDRIYFTEPFRVVFLMYKSLYSGEDGLPYLNSKEQMAIATYCAYATLYKQGLKTRDANTIQLAAALKADWLKACSQARVPEEFSQNDMNEILDAQTSWDRHSYGRTSKPIY